MLSQLKMNPDPAYQNRLLPERDNASFLMDIQYGFIRNREICSRQMHLRLNLKLLPFGISSEGDAIFSCMDRKQVRMAVRLTSDGKLR